MTKRLTSYPPAPSTTALQRIMGRQPMDKLPSLHGWKPEALNVCAAEVALFYLQQARDLYALIGAAKTKARVDSALSSAKGAVRNENYRVNRRREVGL